MTLVIKTVEESEEHEVRRLVRNLIEWNLTVAPPEDAHLDTYDFQSLDFYTGLGYTQSAELEDYPPRHTRHFLRKVLS